MTSAWELTSAERGGQAGRRAIVAKTFRMHDGSESVFTLPGGGVEPGETLAGGAARELAEETAPSTGMTTGCCETRCTWLRSGHVSLTLPITHGLVAAYGHADWAPVGS